MLRKSLTFIIMTLLCACSEESDSKNNQIFYDYYYSTKDQTDKIILRFNKKSISRYSGWKHKPNRSEFVQMWYPSLIDKTSANIWISTKKEQEKAEIKPQPDDREISLKIGKGSSNRIVDPNITVEGRISSYCRINGSFKKFTKDGVKGKFHRYKYVQETKPEPLIHYLYHPIDRIKGLYCIKCNSITCQMIGITDFGIHFTATESYVENRMVNEALEIQAGINEYLLRKIVKEN